MREASSMQQEPGRPTTRPPWAWRVVVFAVVRFLRWVRRWQVQARRPDVLPRPGQPLVVAFNHTSSIDGFLITDVLWRRLRRWGQPLVRAEVFDLPVIGGLLRGTGAIPVARAEVVGRGAAYDDAVAQLHTEGTGSTVMVAPESTITHDGTLLPLRHGAARLALEAGVDVLVATHFGAQRGFSPIVRFPERGVVVTVTFDLITPRPNEDAASLTGRIAAIMLDRSEELRATYPQADPDARWWPPYSAPASPTATAISNLKHYRESMTEAVAQARERVTETIAEPARDRIEELAAHARERAAQLQDRLPTGDGPDPAEAPEHSEGPAGAHRVDPLGDP